MKRNSTLLLILALFLTCNFASAKTPQLRGADQTIASLDSTYCNNEANALIVPDNLDPKTLYVTWKVAYSLGGLDQPSLYSLTGSGRDVVLHFNPNAVPSNKYGQKIYFIYQESDDDAILGGKSDKTKVFPIPTPFNLANDTTICPGGTASIRLLDSETDIKYILYKNGVRTAATQMGTTNSISFNVTSIGTYSLKAQNINDTTCMINMNNSVVVSMFPVVNPIITGAASVCIGASNVIYSANAGMSAYVWTITAGGIKNPTANPNEISVVWISSGNQNITVNYTDLNGCSALTPKSKPVTVNPLPIPTISGNAAPCVNTTTTYSTEVGMTGYNWSIPVGSGTITNGAATNTITVNWTTVGNHKVAVSYTDTHGCTPGSSTEYNVSVKARPTPTFTAGAASVCQGTTGVIYQTEAGQSSYSWSIPTGGTITAGATTNQITVTWNTAGAQTVNVNYANSDGCTAQTSTSYAVTVRPAPTPTITGKDTICLGVLGTVYTTESGKSNYTWTIPTGGTIVSGGTTYQTVVNWQTAGYPRTIRVNYQDTNGCLALTPTTKNVIVSDLPVPTLTGSDSVCAGTTNVAYTTEAAKNNYTWTITGGGTITSGALSNQPKVTWNTPGDNIMTVTYKNIYGCQAAAPISKNIFVKISPTPTISGPNSFCLDPADTKTYTTQAGMSSYNWTVSSGGTIIGASNTSTLAVQWNTAGTKTVTVNYSLANGCLAPSATQYTVTVKPSPTPVITGLTTTCDGVTYTYSTDALNANYTWNVSPGDVIISGNGTNTVDVTWKTVGAHFINVNYSNSDGCYALTPTNEVITVLAAPNPTFTSGKISACQGDTETYTTEAGMTNYVWTVPTGGTIFGGQGTNTLQVTWDTQGNHSVTVNYKNSNGCFAVNPSTLAVSVNPTPNPTITGVDSVCHNSTFSYTTELGMSGYTWTANGGTILSGQGTYSVSVKWDNVGAHSLQVNYNNGTGCPAKTLTTLNVDVYALPIPTITGNNTVCTGYTTNYTTEAGMTNYTWSISGGGTIISGAGTNEISVNWTTAGKRAVKVSYMSVYGCLPTTESIDSITVNTSPTPTFTTGALTVCEGATLQTYSTTAGQTNYDWQISAGGTITSGLNTNSVNVTWTTPGSQTISINYKNAAGCLAVNPTVRNVNVVAKPVPTITGSISICQNDTLGYKTESGMNNYNWTVSGGTILSGQNTDSITVKWNTAGSQNITVTYKNATSCSPVAPTNLTVTVNAIPVPTITGTKAVCTGFTITYTTELGMSNYNWSISGGGTITSGAGTDAITVNWTTPGKRAIRISYISAAGCNPLAETIDTVTVTGAPTPSFLTGPITVCEGATLQSYSTQTLQNDYDWQISAGGTITSGLNTNIVNVTWTTPGPQTISINYKNAAGCIAASPTTRNVNVVAKPVPTITGNIAVCQNDTQGYKTESSMNTYSWTVSGGTILNGQNTDSITVKWNTTGAQNITVTYKNSTSCSPIAPTNLGITVNALPVPTITGTKAVCSGFTIAYNTEGGMSNYNWSISGGGTITSGTGTNAITVNWTTPGKRAIRISYTSTDGCNPVAETIDTVTVTGAPTPSFLTGPTAVCEGATLQSYSTQTGQNNYDWQISAGGTITSGLNTSIVNVTWTTPGPQTISINYKNAAGCIAASPTTRNVNVVAKPVPTITGFAAVCQNDTQGYKTESGMNNYSWTVSGGTILSGQNTDSISVKWNNTGTQNITVTYKNSTGCAPVSASNLSITVNTLPVPTITGDLSVCNGFSATYTTETGMSNYNWTISGGGVIAAGTGTNSIIINWTSAGKRAVRVSYLSPQACAPTNLTIDTVVVTPAPVPNITGSILECEGTTNLRYYTALNENNYDWQISSGGTIVSGLGTYEIFVNWNTPGAQTITVNFENVAGCKAASPTVKNVTVVGKPVPTITGLINSCTADTVTYSTESGMNTYAWTISAGGTILSGQGTKSISVLWNVTGAQTLSVTYKNSAGCTPIAATTQNIAVGIPATPTITGTKALCAGVTTTYSTEAGMSNYIWAVSSGGTLVSGSGTNQITVTWNSAGTRTVTVNYDNAAGCNATKNKIDTVTVYNAPAPSIGGLTTVCEGATNISYNTTAGMTSYDWNVTGGTITSGSGTNIIQVTWNTPGSRLVTLNYQNPGGCSAAVPSSRTINVVAKPVPTITGTATVCQEEINTYSTEAGMNTYNWTVSAGGTIIGASNLNTVQVKWSTVGAHTISVTYNNSTGCTPLSATVKNITVNAVPAPTITGSQTACENETGVLYTTEAGMSNYDWIISGGTITAGLGTNQITVKWITPGKNALKVNYKNAAGCFATLATIDSITVNPITIPTITGSTPVCQGATNVVYTTEIGLNNYNWTVSAGGTITAGQGTYQINVSWNTVGAQSLTATYKNQFGCQAATPSSKAISVIAKPVPTITGSATACLNVNTTYSTEAGMSSYSWVVPAGGLIVSANPTTSSSIVVRWSTTGAKTVSVNYVIPGNCTADSPTIHNLDVKPIPVPTLVGPDTICANGSAYEFTTDASQINYTWAYDPSATLISGAGTDKASFGWITPGNKSITITYRDSYGCQSVGKNINTYAKASPAPSITGTKTLCAGAQNVKYYTESPFTDYTWAISAGGTIVSGAGTDTLVVNWNTPGKQTISVSYKNSTGCTGTKLDTVTVNALPVPKITANNNGCIGSNTTITTDAAMSSYVWTVSAGGTILSGQGTRQIVVNWSATGNETVSITYKNAAGCDPVTPTVKTFTVSNIPTVVLTSTEDTICAGTAVTFNATAGLSNYKYYINAASINNGSNRAYTSSSLTDNAQIYVIGTSTNGCLGTSNTINMKVYAIPDASLAVSPNTSIVSGTNTTFTATGTGLYQFYLNGNIVQAYSSDTSYASSTLSNNDVISLKVKNGNDCYDSTAVTISVLDTIIKKAIIASVTSYCAGGNGASIVLNNPQSGVTYELFRTSDNAKLGTGTISASSITWNNIKPDNGATREYKVIGYYPAFSSNKVEMSNRVTITEVPLPATYFVTPTGTSTNCNAGIGFEIKLSDSDTGVDYFLYRNGSATGISLAGTGNGLNFGFQVMSGTYTVVAKNSASTSCTTTMSGSFAINTATQTSYNLTSNPANGHYCANASGVVLSLDGSTNAVNYLLYRNGTTYVKTVKGTGAAISFGNQTIEGVYTVVVNESGCLTSMNGAVTIVKENLPAAYTLSATNNGVYCEGAVGMTISLSNQEIGVDYQLLYNGVAVGAPVSASVAGAAFDFPGNYLTEGVYSVLATKTDAGCISTSANTVTVDKTMTPANLDISGDTIFCDGATANVNILSSESDVTYKLIKNNVLTGASSLGNGGLLTFVVSQEGTYKVEAQRVVAGVTCPYQLTDSIVIKKTIYPDVKAYTWVNGTSCTQGTVITIIQTQVGAEYQLYNRANNLALTGYTLTGDGSDLSFPDIVDTNGDYYIVAKNGSCGLEFTNPGDVHVAIAGAVQKQEVVIPTAVCSNSTSVVLGLKDTENTVTYDLYLVGGDKNHNDTIVKTFVGDGLSKSFATVSTEGDYYVIGTSTLACSVEMLNRVTVKFNKLPKVYTLSGNGYFCPSMNGTTLSLDSTEAGVTYSLQIKVGAGWNTVKQIVGSGSAISFNNVSTDGEYSVLATAINGCTSTMNNTVIVAMKSIPTAFAVSVDNSNYCSNSSTGADINIAGTQKDVSYFVINISTNDTITYTATADNASPIKLATVTEGFYNVWAAWLGSACDVNITPTPLQVAKLSLQIKSFDIVLDDVMVCNGDSTYIRVTDAENGVLYDIEKDGVMLNTPLDIANGEVKWKISGLASSFSTYKVFAYKSGYKPCGFYANNPMILETRVKPTGYNLTPTVTSICKGDASTIVAIKVSGGQNNMIYSLYNASNTLISTYTSTVNSAFTFAQAVSPGSYSVIAKYNTGNCSASMNNVASITEDDSSLICFPFEAVKDMMYLPKDKNTGTIHVSNNAEGGNDILSSLVDINLEYKLITSWTDANGNQAQTNGTVSFDNSSNDSFTYTKTGNFYGKDSVIYEITNLDHKNRKDTAIIYIFVGNQEIEPGITILIPNAFSPNGDGKNDYFILEGIEGLISSDLQVFNRWGALVYRSTGDTYTNNFDGTANSGVSIGKELPVGTYFYLYNATFKNNGSILNKKFNGYIELRR